MAGAGAEGKLSVQPPGAYVHVVDTVTALYLFRVEALAGIILYLLDDAPGIGRRFPDLAFEHIGKHVDARELIAYLIMKIFRCPLPYLALLLAAQSFYKAQPGLPAAVSGILQRDAQEDT